MEKKDSQSVKLKIWIYFILFALEAIIIAWLISELFMFFRYDQMKYQEIFASGEETTRAYVAEDNNDRFQLIINDLHEKHGVDIYIFEVHSELEESYISYNLSSAFLVEKDAKIPFALYADFLRRLEDSKTEYVTFVPKNSNSTFIYGNSVEKDGVTRYIYVSGTMMQGRLVSKALREQVLIVGISILVTGSFMTMFISRRVYDPIMQTIDAAREVAGGNLSAIFSANGYSEIEDLSAELNLATMEMRKTNNLREDFIANVTHDLRTPLTMVKAYAEMIRDLSGDDKEKRDEHTQVIIEESDRLTTLVNDILQLSKLQSGVLKLEIEEFNLTTLVEKVAKNLDIFVQTNQCVLNVKLEKNAYILADPRRIEQVIYNLIANAINYTGEDKKVTVEIKKDDGLILLQVSDTGDGIVPEQLEHIWEKYYRGANHKKTIIGSGLGLSIVKSMLDEHALNYGVDSAVGIGSVFWIYFPEIK